MNRIILACSAANIDLANKIDNQLSRIGIPFELVVSEVSKWPEKAFGAGEPVLLLVTDNLLTDRACMDGLLETLQRFPGNLPFLPVIADGTDEAGNAVSTSIDRMVNMLHYMNHWQNAWLKISTDYQAASGAEKLSIEKDLDAVRLIANQTGDLITLFREKGAVSMAELEANDFALFFEKFGLSDWHGQYRRLASENPEAVTPTPTLLPETPLSSGILALQPVEEPSSEPIPDLSPAHDSHDSHDLSPALSAIQDAHFWIERGHVERGVELLQLAAAEFPENEELQAAYLQALSQLDKPVEVNMPEISQPEPQVQPQPEAPEAAPPPAVQDAGPYDLMGNTAYEKGDFLFAKYCWDRAAELNPIYPDIYRKLGLMTAEHLHDYRETAVVYLKKALEINPSDGEVHRILNELQAEASPGKTESWQEAPAIPTPEPVQPAPEPVPDETPMEQGPQPIVLITGATSGIGRATAEVFAQNGYRLILTGRRVERLVEVKNHLNAAYLSDVLLLPFDVRDAGAVQSAIDSIPESYREIDVLVNNAGLAKGLSPIHEGSLEHWETMIDTNVKGLLYITRLISQGMVARRKGHIINVGSSAGKEVYPNGNVYCATKFAVDALTKGIRYDLHKFNIRVSQVSPGHVEETEFALTRFDGDAERAKIYNDFQPLKASDVADAIYFMASRPPHVNVQDLFLFGTQQAASMLIDRSGR